MEMEEVQKMIDQYFGKEGESGDYFRHALRTKLADLQDIDSLRKMTKLLAVNLADTAYIAGADAIEAGEMVQGKYFDYGCAFAIAGKVTISKVGQRSIGRLLVYINRKMEQAEATIKSLDEQKTELSQSVSKLIRGKAELVDCDVCEGTGQVYSCEETCWNCNGDKKVIEDIEG